MRRPSNYFSRFSALIAGLICLFGLGILAAPSNSETQGATTPRSALVGTLVHGLREFPAAASIPTVTAQDAGQATPPAAAPAAPKPVELPEGDGKAIATEYCQMCHRLTNLTKAHKDLDDWKDTIQTMIDRGASIPDDKVPVLAAYLAKNFGPQATPPAANAPAAAPAANAPAAAPETNAPASPAPSPATSAPSPSSASPGTPSTAQPAPVVLPDGPGKAIAEENCQACHRLTNLTKAHKSLDDWKDTIQTMIDRGANIPDNQVDTLAQYLAKNFGPKDTTAAPSTLAPAATPATTPAQ